MNKTNIEYLDMSWNPIAMRCTPVSAGCANCWHLRMADRMAGNSAFPDDVRAAYAGTGPPVLVQKRLEEPLRRKQPAMIGAQFMGDLFCEAVPFQFAEQVFQIMVACNGLHTFMVLTKRPMRVKAYYASRQYLASAQYARSPYGNIQLGVSVEDQQTADERIPHLLQTPAAMRVVSVEPMLAEIDLSRYLHCGISWCIIGSESGPNRRPMKEEWARRLIAQCKQTNVPVFYKQAYKNGRKISMPMMDGRRYSQYPQTIDRQSES